jgi:hypothetical protein
MMKSAPLIPLICAALFAGCSTQRFVASYAIDPKPPHTTYSDLKSPANPKPVAVIFDMYRGAAPFPEGTAKFGRKIGRIVDGSGLFSNVAKVPSEQTARLQISLTELATVEGSELKSLPAGLTSGLAGSEAAVLYMFTGNYQPAGKPAAKKVYHQAIHILNSKHGWQQNDQPLTASQATDAMIEQLTLTFLHDLQRDGSL